MAPVTHYVFAEMLGISKHFTAGSHEWLPYSDLSTFPKQYTKHQFISLPPLYFLSISSRPPGINHDLPEKAKKEMTLDCGIL